MKKIATIMPHFLRSLFTLSFPASPFHLFIFTLALCSLLFALSSCRLVREQRMLAKDKKENNCMLF